MPTAYNRKRGRGKPYADGEPTEKDNNYVRRITSHKRLPSYVNRHKKPTPPLVSE